MRGLSSTALKGLPGVLALVGALALGGPGGGCSGGCGARPRGVVLVIVDTLRADHLGCYGYGRPTSPAIDRIAAVGELYREAWAVSPWTLPSIATILTGLPQGGHGAGAAEGGGFLPVREDVAGLAVRLSGAGWATGAVVNVEFLAPGSGLERGFDQYDYRPSAAPGEPARDARGTTAAALAWARTVRDRPFFLVVHYFDPHLPYDPPEPFASRFEPSGSDRAPAGFGRDVRVVEAMRGGGVTPSSARRESLVARYDGEIAYVDEQVGALRAGLEELGLWDRSLFVLVADHGEELWDHGGFEHGHSHYHELLHVPLVVRRPGGSHVEVSARVSQLDVGRTVLAFAGLDPDEALPGRPLPRQDGGDAVAFGSLWAGPLASIRGDEGALIVDLATGARRFFAPTDRAEARDALAERPGEAAALEGRLRGALAASGPAAPRRPWPMAPELAEQLRALGYVRSDGGAPRDGGVARSGPDGVPGPDGSPAP